MEAIQHLHWRYATKKYISKTLEDNHLQAILESIRLTPTSLGLQPLKVWVVESEVLRDALLPIANNQPQIKQASHILIFAAYTAVTDEMIQNYMQNVATTRNMPVENLEGFSNMIKGFVGKLSPAELQEWTARQTYIALGVAMATAAHLKVDSTPMEGFSNEKLDELLQLPQQNLKSTVMLAIGHRDEANDPLSKVAKVRKPSSEIFVFE